MYPAEFLMMYPEMLWDVPEGKMWNAERGKMGGNRGKWGEKDMAWVET